MSAKQRLLVDMADIVALRLECEKCGAAISLPPAKVEGGLDKCANCLAPWRFARTDAGIALMTFFKEVDNTRPYRVQFEIERS